jgi:hypothetical protein
VGRTEPCPAATDVAWIRRVVPNERDTNHSRWPTDPVWRVVQSATFADAPAEARRLIRHKQRGNEVKVLDAVQYGCLVSRVALRHSNGGEWSVSQALGEACASLEALEAQAGKDFGAPSSAWVARADPRHSVACEAHNLRHDASRAPKGGSGRL